MLVKQVSDIIRGRSEFPSISVHAGWEVCNENLFLSLPKRIEKANEIPRYWWRGIGRFGNASNRIKGLRKFDPDAKGPWVGGDLMREAGCEIVRHYKDTAIMGFLTVLKNLDKIKQILTPVTKDMVWHGAGCRDSCGFGGFNLRVARFINDANIPVFLIYFPSKIWAWNTGRVKKIKRLVDRGCS